MGTGHRRARTAAAALLATLLLGGCGLLGGGERGGGPEWIHDEDSGRYFRTDLVTDSPDLVEEHFPMLDGTESVRSVEGRFTDPSERAPFPAQDDHWWQAVVELEPAQVQELLDATSADGASDLGGAEAPEPVDAEEVRAGLVPPLEEHLGDCPGGWVDVTPALARSGSQNVSEAGDMLELAAVCDDGAQLVLSARDM